jgi:hypothetical protein
MLQAGASGDCLRTAKHVSKQTNKQKINELSPSQVRKNHTPDTSGENLPSPQLLSVELEGKL